MSKFEYDAMVFRQQAKSPVLVSFVAHAGEILKWAGIPRKSDELLTGYQRFRDSDRIDQEIVPFFNDDRNASPTAIIIALRKVSGVGSCELSIGNQEISPGKMTPAKLTISIDDQTLQSDKVFEAASAFVKSRLLTAGDTDRKDDTEQELEDENAIEQEDDEAFVHLGTVTLQKLKVMLDKQELWVNESFRAAIVDFVKPALLIDGQHRVTGAAKIGDRGIPFIVCGLFNAPWEEQVFQFTVVNLKQKKIPPSLITSIAALSLTKTEQEHVEARLEQAGVRMPEVTVMSLVAYDDNSPFVEKIDMAVGSAEERADLLGYGSAKRIAYIWYRATRTSLTQIAKQLFQTNSSSTARSRWRDERSWFEFFSAFWSAVRDHYHPTLWAKSESSRLFIGAHLWALQEAILSEADGQMASNWKVPDDLQDYDKRRDFLIAKLLEVVTTMLDYFPEELWKIHWRKASQDTNQGREDLVQLFEKFIEKGKKGGKWKNWKQDPWFAQED